MTRIKDANSNSKQFIIAIKIIVSGTVMERTVEWEILLNIFLLCIVEPCFRATVDY